MPFLSVVIPLYNKEKHIKRTIESILVQSFADFEIVIVNDGSTDNSLSVVEGIKDKRIRIITQQNSGVSAARNRGIVEAQGVYILLLDADDCLLVDAFNLIKKAPNADIIVGSFNQVCSNGKITRRLYNTDTGIVSNPYKDYCNKTFFIRIGNFFAKREFLKQKGFLRTDLTLYEDEEWFMRIIDGAVIYSSDQVVLEYVREIGGLSVGFKPIEKDWASIASVKGIHNRYQKRIIGDFVFRRFYVRLKRKDWHGVKLIWHNNSWRMLYCLISFVRRAIKGGFIKNRLNNRIE